MATLIPIRFAGKHERECGEPQNEDCIREGENHGSFAYPTQTDIFIYDRYGDRDSDIPCADER